MSARDDYPEIARLEDCVPASRAGQVQAALDEIDRLREELAGLCRYVQQYTPVVSVDLDSDGFTPR